MQEPTLPEHSAAKVRLLGEYLKRFLSVISNDGYTKTIDIYDLFCGDGSGSPSIIMSEVKNSYFARKARGKDNPTINCLFNDVDPEKVDLAAELIRRKNLHYEEFGGLDFKKRDYAELIRVLLEEMTYEQSKKTFVFIDPYGYKHIQGSQIQALLAKRNVEVLLFLPIQFMYRFDANGTPEALHDFVSELVDPGDWKPNDDVWNYIDQLKNGFKHKLGSNYFVDTFTIQKDAQTVFCLFFFSGHIKGFEKMLEAKWELDEEQGKGWHYVGSSSGSLFLNQKTNPLETSLIEFLTNSSRNNSDLYTFTLQLGFLPKHTTEVLSNLQENGRLKVVKSNGESIRRGAYYVNYQNHRDSPAKALFSLI